MPGDLISGVEEILGHPVRRYKEGRINFLAPAIKTSVSASDIVFYNPRMEFSRDVCVCIIQAYQRMLGNDIDLCEPLASCCVRAVRWACEVTGVRSIVAADINPRAVLLGNVNAVINGVLDKLEVVKTDANLLLNTCSSLGRRFDVIDIDPFGSPVYYIDSALKSIKRGGGLLCLTATDMQLLCGIHQDACVRRYGGASLRTEYCHEIAIRLLIGAAVRAAGKHDVGLRVVFSHSSDHYVRTYLLAKRNAIEADENARKIGYILHCFKCGNRRVVADPVTPLGESECELCGSLMRNAGPLWCGTLWERRFVEAAQKIAEQEGHKQGGRLIKMLDSILSEIDGPPTYYDLHGISDLMGTNTPPTSVIIELLQRSGFFASPTHFRGTCVRTTASIEMIRSILNRSISSS